MHPNTVKGGPEITTGGDRCGMQLAQDFWYGGLWESGRKVNRTIENFMVHHSSQLAGARGVLFPWVVCFVWGEVRQCLLYKVDLCIKINVNENYFLKISKTN